ncbi:metalloproteinase inhibitor 1-like [Lissotriton helveticus]
MESMTWKLFAPIMLLLLVASPPSRACDCVNAHLQSHFCNSDVVTKAVFLREAERNNSVKGYEVKIKEVFKGGAWLSGIIFIDNLDGTSCEVKIDPTNFNKDYLITASGSSATGYLEASGCGVIRLWTELTSRQALGIQKAYKDGCSCEIISSFQKPCDSKCQQCKLDGHEEGGSQNQAENQACIPKGGTCSWQTIQ